MSHLMAAGIALLLLGACAADDEWERTLRLTPGSLDMWIGQTDPVVAEVVAGDNAVVATDIVWSSTDTAVADLLEEPDGWVTVRAMAPGRTVVTARHEGDDVQASVQVDVREDELLAIELTPEATVVSVLDGFVLSALSTYVGGSSVDIARAATWSVEPAGVAIQSAGVNINGAEFTARMVGEATISATFAGVTGSTVVTVE